MLSRDLSARGLCIRAALAGVLVLGIMPAAVDQAHAASRAPSAQAATGERAAPVARAAADERSTVFRCATADGAVMFSDEPCVGAPQVKVWTPATLTPGIVRSTGPAGAAAPRPRATAVRYDPFVDCQRRGGRFDLSARICHLPEDAARAMFSH